MRPITLLLCFAVASCTTAVTRPDARDAHWAAERWPGTTVDDLSRGRELFVMRCAGCHQLHEPGEKSPDEWAVTMAEMGPRARVGRADRELMLRYLSAASVRAHRPVE